MTRFRSSTHTSSGVRCKVLGRLYEKLLGRIKADRQQKVFLMGARGFGKSCVLAEIRNADHENRGAAEKGWEERTIAGRDWLESNRVLKKLEARGGASEAAVPDLYFDDLDYYIRRIDAQLDGRRPDAEVKAEESQIAVSRLLNVVNMLADRRRRIIVTSTMTQSRFQSLFQSLLLKLKDLGAMDEGAIYAASVFFIDSEPYRLEPWQFNWRERMQVVINESLEDYKLDPRARVLCSSIVGRLTDGHPALLARSVKLLLELLGSDGSLDQRLRPGAGSFEPTPEIEADLRFHLEDRLLQEGMGSPRRALAHLSSSTDLEMQRAREDLLAFAADPDHPLPAKSRDILLGEGLLFRDPEDSTYSIPGELLRTELRSSVDGVIIVELVPDPDDPTRRGSVIARAGSSEREVDLTGGTWSVLGVLFDQAPSFVSIEDLEELTHLNSEHAVRSAIQRLNRELRAAGIDGLIENQYRKGYRKGTSVSWIDP